MNQFGLQDILPLSPLQEGILFHHVYDTTAPDIYAVQIVVDLAGALDAAALRAAANGLLRRHANLRAGFRYEGISRPVQIVPRWAETPWQEIDLRDLEPERVPRETERIVAADRARRLDLARPPLLRFTLLLLPGARHRLILTFHHILLDGWSIPLLWGELLALYRAHGDDRGMPPVRPYKDYLSWLAEQDQGAAQRAWRAALDGLSEPTLVAPGLPPAGQPPEQLQATLSEATTASLTEWSRGQGLTLNTVIQAAWALQLARLTGRDDVLAGITVSGRPAELDGIDTMIGLFINTVPLRARLLRGESLTGLLHRLQSEQAALMAHQHLGLAEIQGLAGLGGRAALFDTIVTFENYPARAGSGAAGAELRVTGVQSVDANHYVLSLVAAPGTRLLLRLDHRTDAVSQETAERILTGVVEIVEAVAAAPDQPVGRLLSAAADVRQLPDAAFGRDTAPQVTGLPELFSRVATRDPGAVAVVSDAGTLTYAQLDAHANRLAHQLVAAGVGRETPVVMLLERTAAVPVAVLAVLKAGGFYVPLHDSYPVERMRAAAAEVGGEIILADRWTADRAAAVGLRTILVEVGAEAGADSGPDVPVHPDQAAYVMFTSGSTGTPKGVVVTHRGVAELALDRRWAGGAHERVLMAAARAFDASTYELWIPLLSGGRIVLAPPGRLDVDTIRRTIAAHGVTGGLLTTALFNLIAEEAPEALSGMREVTTGGDAASAEAFRRVLSHCPDLVVTNLYGPTEITMNATHHAVRAGDELGSSVPIGRPMDGTRLYVLDAGLRPVPQGMTGELYLAGAGLARGYAGRAGSTAERFVADRFGPPGARMYRTGDMARWLPGGVLEFAGRADDQVKLRGFRVEPGEVAGVLERHPGVTRAVVLAREDRPGDKRLVAYLTRDSEAEVTAGELTAHASRSLPDYMVPSAFVVLDALPVTANGKLDRHALPAPGPADDGQARAARTPQEQILCGLFADVLGLPEVGADDDLFERGGNSLIATRLVSRVRSTFRVELAIRELFEAPTPARLWQVLDRAGRGRAGVTPTRPLPERVPLSFAQQRLWFLSRVEGANPTYNIPLPLRLTGRLDTAALHAALADVATRHETLRTVIREDGDGPYQVVLDEAAPEPAFVATTEAELDARLAEAAAYRFDLGTEPPWRAWIFRLEPTVHVLLLLVHHIAGDGWSMPLLRRDLAVSYAARCAGRAPEWDPLPVQYADYTLWQRTELGSVEDPDSPIAGQLAYWRAALDGLPEELELPSDRRRPAVSSNRGGMVTFHVPAPLYAAVTALARRNRATVFMVLQAALATLLCRLGAGTDIPIGTPIAGRTDDAIDGLVGFFVNSLVLRTDLAGDPAFDELIAQVRETDLAAYAHQELPFERLVEELNPVRSLARHPLYQVQLALNNNDQAAAAVRGVLPDLEVSAQPVTVDAAKFDLLFSFGDRRTTDGGVDGLLGSLEYSFDLFDRSTAERITRRLLRVLETAVADPSIRVSRIDVLEPQERRRLLAEWNDTTRETPWRPLPEIFEEQAARTPDRPAVIDGDTVLTYAEVNARANRLARLLIGRDAGPESYVAIAVPRSADEVVAVLAAAKTGAAYLPVDPALPAERIDFMLLSARPTVVITTMRHASQMPGEPDARLELDRAETVAQLAAAPAGDVTGRERLGPLLPDHPLYVIYTSGSTGRPKAVVVRAGGIANLLRWQEGVLPGDAAQMVAHFAPVTFDVSVQELFSALLSGKTLVLCPEEVRRNAEQLVDWLDRHGVQELFAPNLVVEAIAEAAEEHQRFLPALRDIIQSGEALLPGRQMRAFHDRVAGRRMHNQYGPTETHVITGWVLPERTADWDAAPDMGGPIANARLYVLDHRLRLLPPGVTGELYIAGAGLGRGYLNRPDMTAERFVADPFAPGRMYRTGDLVRWTPDGRVRFVARADHQVKIRGFRVELGEVEATVARHPSVAQAAVILREDAPGDRRMVAYVVPANGDQPDVGTLRKHVATSLPDYMMPAAFVTLPHLPLTRNGKLDRRALPAPGDGDGTTDRPRTPEEEVLAGLFGEFLGLPSIGVHDDFFASGGHSFLATRLIRRVNAAFGTDLSVRSLFAAPTVAQLAVELGADVDRDAFATLLPLRPRGSRPPLFCVHPGSGTSWCYAGLLGGLPSDEPVYGLQARGLSAPAVLPSSIDEMVADYLAEIRAVTPEGPYRLMGWSFGGLVAHALAVSMQAKGLTVDRLVIVDAYPPALDLPVPERADHDIIAPLLAADFPFDPAELTTDPAAVLSRYAAYLARRDDRLAGLGEQGLRAAMSVYVNNNRLMATFPQGVFDGDLLFLAAGRDTPGVTWSPEVRQRLTAEAWQPFVTGRVERHTVDATHNEMLTDPSAIRDIAAVLARHG
ncbi:amino acid adenylation domain-containing protein [Mangrovihabitans endophyticus]|uniref:Carrier domain-containing protein n=1 Tax=Mangrovihabitans endophyticus TaxID=1751298 RepID=A0A8J3BVW5_9ACTN|nr:non-ribosomal peptide synthetase [Mangrovihabitans endophyticus]GGK73152.1 hypothetical protein GCM10012284_03780 [Mangrovihabitans endophyticus]